LIVHRGSLPTIPQLYMGDRGYRRKWLRGKVRPCLISPAIEPPAQSCLQPPDPWRSLRFILDVSSPGGKLKGAASASGGGIRQSAFCKFVAANQKRKAVGMADSRIPNFGKPGGKGRQRRGPIHASRGLSMTGSRQGLAAERRATLGAEPRMWHAESWPGWGNAILSKESDGGTHTPKEVKNGNRSL
jgi:hypothetical protein